MLTVLLALLVLGVWVLVWQLTAMRRVLPFLRTWAAIHLGVTNGPTRDEQVRTLFRDADKL